MVKDFEGYFLGRKPERIEQMTKITHAINYA